MQKLNIKVASIVKLLVLSFSLTVLMSGNVFALTVEYDTTFSTDGYDIISGLPVATDIDDLFDMAVQTDGKMVTAGSRVITSTGEGESVVRRYSVDGTLDPTFGVGGMFSHNFSPGMSNSIDSVCLQPDGKILASGNLYKSSAAPLGYDKDALVLRLNTDGTLDTTFSSDGFEVFDGLDGTPLSNDYFRSVYVDTNSRVFLAGASSGSGSGVVVKLDTAGIPDNAFGASGIAVQKDVGVGRTNNNTSLITDGNGAIYVTGSTIATSPTYNSDLIVWKLQSNGSVDASFDTDGKLIIDDVGADAIDNYDSGSKVLLDGTKIMVLVSTDFSASYSISGAVIRLNADGTYDNTFASSGIYLTDAKDWLEGFTVTGDAYYLVGAHTNSPSGFTDSAVWKISKSGVLDTSFGTGGMFVMPELDYFLNHWGTAYAVRVVGSNIYVAASPFDDDTFRYVASVARLRFGNEVINVPVNTTLTDISGSPITLPLSGVQTVRLKQTTLNVPVVEFSANFDTGNLDLSGVIVDSSIAEGKAVVSGLNGVHTIYVPKRAQDTSVIICPNAQTIAEVTLGCSGALVYDESDSGVAIVNIGGQDYWKVDGLTGTGGQSGIVAGANTTETSELADTGSQTHILTVTALLIILTTLSLIPRKIVYIANRKP